MAKYYISTININVWKEHTCVGCGAAYRYLLKRTKSARGGTPEAASANARAAAARALAQEIDMEPCPTCGLYQPDMVGSRRALNHKRLCAGVFVVLMALLIVASLVSYYGRRIAPVAAAAVCIVAGVAHLLVDRRSPNDNPEANRRHAQERLASGRLSTSTASSPAEGANPGDGWSVANLMAYALFPLAVAAFLAPEAMRSISGYPDNVDCWPPVVGPGDVVRINLPQRISSIKSLWNAQATTKVLNAEDLGLPGGATIPTTSKTDSWGQTITIDSGESNSTSQLWVDLHLPEQGGLDGKSLRLQIDLAVHYPEERGNNFDDNSGTFSHTPTLQVASAARAGEQYEAWWWGSVAAGVSLMLAAGLWLAALAGRFRRKAPATRLFAPN